MKICKHTAVKNIPQNVFAGLSGKEHHLLALLAANKNRVINRSTIMEHIWDISAGSSTGTLESHITYLRRKLKQNGLPAIIKTVHGFGYMFCDASAPNGRSTDFSNTQSRHLAGGLRNHNRCPLSGRGK